MSRRRARLHREMRGLAEALRALGTQSTVEWEQRRQRAAGTIERFFLPRLDEGRLPLVIALVGSTGSGKSTILNSIAGRPVSRVGAVRPTTREAVVWSAPAHTEQLEWIGTVSAADHPLAKALALVDTPDLDSDVPEHRQRALLIADASDGLVMVTTAARYGDARPWESLATVPRRPLIVVLNRLVTRSSGSRNFLATQLREISYGDAAVVTISEQKTDRVASKLPHQSLRRLQDLLQIWARDPASVRAVAFDALADRTAADVNGLLHGLTTRRSQHRLLDEIAAIRHRDVAGELALSLQPTKRRRWRRIVAIDTAAQMALVQDALDRAAGASHEEASERGVQLPPAMRLASPSAKEWIRGWSVIPGDLAHLEEILVAAGSSWAALLPRPSDESIDQLTMGLEMLTDLEWPGD